MTNINNKQFSTPGAAAVPEVEKPSVKGKEREVAPQPKSVGLASDDFLEAAAESRSENAPKDKNASQYRFYDALHQAGTDRPQAGVSLRDSQKYRQEDAAQSGSSSARASAFSQRAKKVNPVPVGERIKQIDAQPPKMRGKQVKAMIARVADRVSRRVPSLPAPDKITVHRDKLDGYALNSAHERGGDKSVVFSKAGFKRIGTWVRGNPESWRKPADEDPEYQAGRNALISGLKEDATVNHATRQQGPVESYYTKHTVLAPGEDPENAVVAKATWQYNRSPELPETAHLTSIMPSRYSTDDDAEVLEELARRASESKVKK